MPTLAQATALTLADAGYERLPAPAPSGGVAPSGFNMPLWRGPTAPIGNSPVLGLTPARGLPRQQVAAVPPLSDAAFQGGSGTSTTAVATTAVVSSGASSSTVIAGSLSLTATNTALTTPFLNQNDTFSVPVQMGRTFVLFRVAVSAPARVQLYASALAQQADTGRPTTQAPTYGAATGLIADLNLASGAESAWVCSPVIVGANAEQPRTPSAYLTVTNVAASSTPITVTLFYLPLEN